MRRLPGMMVLLAALVLVGGAVQEVQASAPATPTPPPRAAQFTPSVTPRQTRTPTYTPIPGAPATVVTGFAGATDKNWRVVLSVAKGLESHWDYQIHGWVSVGYAFKFHEVSLEAGYERIHGPFSVSDTLDGDAWNFLFRYKYKFAYDFMPSWVLPYVTAAGGVQSVNMEDQGKHFVTPPNGLIMADYRLGFGAFFVPLPKLDVGFQFEYQKFSAGNPSRSTLTGLPSPDVPDINELARFLLDLDVSYQISMRTWIGLNFQLPVFSAGATKEDFGTLTFSDQLFGTEKNEPFIYSSPYLGAFFRFKF